MEATELTTAGAGSKDGSGCADHDTPYVFGRLPRATAPFPFTDRQYAHLLIERGRQLERELAQHQAGRAQPEA